MDGEGVDVFVITLTRIIKSVWTGSSNSEVEEYTQGKTQVSQKRYTHVS